MIVSILDYGAGNVRSVRNAIAAAGYEMETISEASQIATADVIVFPGVGSFQSAMKVLQDKGWDEPLKEYLRADRPFLGICLGMQTLFESSQETGGDKTCTKIPGLGIIPGHVVKFDETTMAVPHIGWNGRLIHQDSPVLEKGDKADVYFVHSFYAPITPENQEWILTTTNYGSQPFISAIQKGNVVATQFHPEKSGKAGLAVLKRFLQVRFHCPCGQCLSVLESYPHMRPTCLSVVLQAVESKMLSSTSRLPTPTTKTQLTKRLVVALDVRTNDHGDLVVTKGDQYDVREKTDANHVRNLGKPVSLAQRYYNEGADEIAFLNITSFRGSVMEDMPMLQVLQAASQTIFVPLTVGGGIRAYKDDQGREWSALQVAAEYFRAGADKVSLGSDAVYAAEAYVNNKEQESSISQISKVYGAQAVVVSVDPKRVYVGSPDASSKHVIVSTGDTPGPNGEKYCWWQCTVKGGRETRDICAVTLAKAVEAMGAGEIMLNSIDMDGQCSGYDLALMNAVSGAVSIPVIASSGAGKPEHFSEVFTKTGVQAALAAGMFHRKEVEIEAVKEHLLGSGIMARRSN